MSDAELTKYADHLRFRRQAAPFPFAAVDATIDKFVRENPLDHSRVPTFSGGKFPLRPDRLFS